MMRGAPSGLAAPPASQEDADPAATSRSRTAPCSRLCGLRTPPASPTSHGSVAGFYGVYLCSASSLAYPCPVRTAERALTGARGTRGFRAVRSATLEEQFAAEMLDWDLPDDWREQVADEVNRRDDGLKLEEAAQWRANLQDERKRVLLQHRYGRISDEDMLDETARIDLVLAALPTPEGRAVERNAEMTAADTLARQRAYWDACTPEQRAEVLRLIVVPLGLVVDLVGQTMTRVKPRAAFLPMLRVVLAGRWREAEDGWLLRV